MYPDWITRSIDTHYCHICSTKLSVDYIDQLGIAWPGESEKSKRGPWVRLIVICPACNHPHCFRYRRRLPDIIDAISLLFQIIELEAPAGNIPNLFDKCKYDDDDSDIVKRNPELESELLERFHSKNPSKKRSMPKTPITDEEFRIFLNILERTSIRRNTKSWRLFVRRIGAPKNK